MFPTENQATLEIFANFKMAHSRRSTEFIYILCFCYGFHLVWHLLDGYLKSFYLIELAYLSFYLIGGIWCTGFNFCHFAVLSLLVKPYIHIASSDPINHPAVARFLILEAPHSLTEPSLCVSHMPGPGTTWWSLRKKESSFIKLRLLQGFPPLPNKTFIIFADEFLDHKEPSYFKIIFVI